MTDKNGSSYEFGSFVLDTTQNLLLRNGEQVKLPAKALELLLFFVRNPNLVIDKETMMIEVWKDSFVEDANLAVHISNLRKILNGDVNGSSAIETFPKVGYRFNGEVIVHSADAEVDSGSPVPNHSIPRPARWVWRRYAPYLIVLLLSLAPLYFGFRWLRSSSPAPVVMSRLSGFEQVVAYAMSADGQYAAQAVRNNGRTSLTMVHLRSNSRIQLVPPDELGIGAMKFSRDGNHLYFTRISSNQKFDLYRTPILTPEPIKLIEDIGLQIGISPKHERVCFVRQIGEKTAIVTVKLDGTEERTLAIREGEEKYWSWSIDWSPDGRQIAVAIDKSGHSSRVVTLDAATGEESPITGPAWSGGGGEGLAWLPDSSGLIFCASEPGAGRPSQLWHVVFPSGDIRKITNDVEAYAVPYVTQDGQIMSAQFEDVSSIWVAAAPFVNAKPFTSPHKHNFNWVRSNSLGQIVFGSNSLGSRDVWMMNSDGSGERQLTQNAGNNVMPVASEEGGFVVFASNRTAKDKYNLWKMNFDGSDVQQLTAGNGDVQPTISPNGKWVYYSTGGLGGIPLERTLWRVASDGGEPEKLVDGPAHGADVAPDGKFFAAWYKPADLGWKLAIFNADGGSPVRLFDAEPGVPVKWAPDGKAIAYLRSVGGVSNVWKQPIAGGSPLQVTRFTSMRTLNFDWTIDGRIVCSRSERITNVVMIRNY